MYETSAFDLKSHLANHIHHPELESNSTLYVIGVVSNPVRYQSRYRLAREWIKAMEKTPHVQLVLVETAFGDRKHELIEANNPWHLQLRTHSEIWIKESMINLGVKNILPKDWKYLAWIDTDVFFHNPGWALETVHQLQHFQVVQPWQDCLDLGPKGTLLETHKSLGYLIAHGIRRQRKPGEPYRFGHPGYAWACTRLFWENIQGLMDFAILGSGDHHMATAMLNEVYTSMHDQMSEGFKRSCHAWQRKAHRICGGKIGYTPAVLSHGFHGSKKKRYYRERWQILVDHRYNPETDLIYDDQGLIRLYQKPALEKEIELYNRSRCEDSIDE